MKKPKKLPDRVPGAQFITGAPGPTIQTPGKVWRLGLNTQNAKGRLEELVRAQVVRDALRLKREVGGDEGEQVWQDTRDALAAGHYDTFEKGWFRILKSAVGNKLFLLSLLQKHHPEATEADALALMVGAREETEAALAVISPDFLLAVARQVATERGTSPEDAGAIATELLAQTTAAPAPPTASVS